MDNKDTLPEWEQERIGLTKARAVMEKINTVVLEKVRSEFGDTVHVFADLQDIEDRDMMLDESQADPGILEVGEYLDRAIASNNILLDIGVRYPKGNDSIREYVLSL